MGTTQHRAPTPEQYDAGLRILRAVIAVMLPAHVVPVGEVEDQQWRRLTDTGSALSGMGLRKGWIVVLSRALVERGFSKKATTAAGPISRTHVGKTSMGLKLLAALETVAAEYGISVDPADARIIRDGHAVAHSEAASLPRAKRFKPADAFPTREAAAAHALVMLRDNYTDSSIAAATGLPYSTVARMRRTNGIPTVRRVRKLPRLSDPGAQVSAP